MDQVDETDSETERLFSYLRAFDFNERVPEFEPLMQHLLAAGDTMPCLVHSVQAREVEDQLIGRDSDLLVGLQLDTVGVRERRAVLDLVIGGKAVCRLELDECTPFRYMYHDRTFVSMINLRFHEVKLHAVGGPARGVRIVWCAVRDNDARRRMVYSALHASLDDGRIGLFHRGMHTVCDRLPDEATLQSLPLPLLEKDRTTAWYMRESRERMETLRQDLVERTWHPSRFTAWCLDAHDEFTTSRAPWSAHAPWMRLGDVLMIDGLFGEEHFAPLQRLMHRQPSHGCSPRLVPDPGGVLALVGERLATHGLASCKPVGGLVTHGCSRSGGPALHEHRDGSLQGGTHSLLVYMSAAVSKADSGGHTVFMSDGDGPDLRVRPRCDRAVLFCVDKLHRADAVSGTWTKEILACEVVFER